MTKSSELSLYELADNKDLVKEIREKFNHSSSDWNEIRNQGTKDLQFYDGEQYDEEQARAARRAGNKVQLRINLLGPFVQQLDNQRRQQNIAISCHATDEHGSDETAEVYEGLFRHIENISNAKHAYNTACGPGGALVFGMGFLRVDTDYVDKTSFDQDIFIRAISDPLKILPDFNAKCPDFSDAEFWFEFEDVTKEDFKAQYPKSQLASFPAWNGMNKRTQGWVNDATVRLCKYWYKETEKRTLVLFEDGTIGYADEYGLEEDEDGNLQPGGNSNIPQIPYDEWELKDLEEKRELKRKAFSDDNDPTTDHSEEIEQLNAELPTTRDASIVNIREINEVKVKWVITNGYEILDEGTWHTEDFPYVPFLGTDITIAGVRNIHGCTRFARDPQNMVNYLSSEIARKTAASNKSQWLVDFDSVPKQFIKDYATSNIAEKSILFFQSKANGRDNIPPPQRLDTVEPQIQNLMASLNNSTEQVKASIGMANPVTTPDQTTLSGTAIQTLAERGDMANFHFTDNFVLSMKRLGEIIIRLIPKIYDTPRVINIIGADSKPELVKINQVLKDGKIHDFSKGTYGVVVDTGPSYATKKAQQADQMIRVAALDPQLTPIILDKVVKDMDWDVSGDLEDRIIQYQAATFPWMAQQAGEDIPPQAKGMITQLQTQLATVGQHFNQAVQEITQLKQEKAANIVDNQAKERIELIKQRTAIDLKKADLLIEMQKAKDDKQLEQMRLHLEHLDNTRTHVINHLQHIDKLNQSTFKQ